MSKPNVGAAEGQEAQREQQAAVAVAAAVRMPEPTPSQLRTDLLTTLLWEREVS